MEHSEDVTQEVFARAHSYFYSFNPKQGEVLNWLYGIASNEISTHLKRRCPREESLDALRAQGEDDGRPPFAEPRAPLPDYDKLIWLDDQLKRMPENVRQAFTLRIAQGYEYEEVAKMLGITAGYAKKLCFKARKMLETEG